MLLDRLRIAERHVAEGEARIRRQREIVAELERDGHDAIHAAGLLVALQEAQAQQIATRDRLRQELATAST